MRGRTGALSTEGTPKEASLLTPCLMLSKGRPMVPGEGGPVPARDAKGNVPDVFDVVDLLSAKYHRIYVVDLDGIERAVPQLDLLQEISRDAETWVDGGVRTAEQAIDILISGAQKAVLSSVYLGSERELRRAWKLSQDLVVDLEVAGGTVVSRDRTWHLQSPVDVERSVRNTGPQELVLSFRPDPVDWEVVRTVAARGPTWVGGSFEPRATGELERVGASGGIFHVQEELARWAAEP